MTTPETIREWVIDFEVASLPITQGSKRLVRNRRTKRTVMLDDNPNLKAWRAQVGWAAKVARADAPLIPLGIPVRITVFFCFAKPKKPSRAYPCAKGGQDVDKLQRAVFDALTGVLWEDDSQVCKVDASKRYEDADGVRVYVRACHPDAPIVRDDGTRLVKRGEEWVEEVAQ